MEGQPQWRPTERKVPTSTLVKLLDEDYPQEASESDNATMYFTTQDYFHPRRKSSPDSAHLELVMEALNQSGAKSCVCSSNGEGPEFVFHAIRGIKRSKCVDDQFWSVVDNQDQIGEEWESEEELSLRAQAVEMACYRERLNNGPSWWAARPGQFHALDGKNFPLRLFDYQAQSYVVDSEEWCVVGSASLCRTADRTKRKPPRGTGYSIYCSEFRSYDILPLGRYKVEATFRPSRTSYFTHPDDWTRSRPATNNQLTGSESMGQADGSWVAVPNALASKWTATCVVDLL